MELVILDRDGVINHDSDAHIKSPDEWKAIPGSLEAIARLNHAGFRVVVASNQPGLSHKLFDIGTLNRIHEKMHRQLAELGGAVEAIFFCPHRDKDDCACRKPRPGLLLAIASRLRTELEGVPVVGDKLSDIEAARAVGARPWLVRTGRGQATLDAGADLRDVTVAADLAEAADALIAERG